jgi:hypothetical protein
MTPQTFIDCGLVDLMTGSTALVVGLDDGPDDSLKVYIGARYKGRYLLVDDPAAQRVIRDAWAGMGHVLIPLPREDQIHQDAPITRASRPLT